MNVEQLVELIKQDDAKREADADQAELEDERLEKLIARMSHVARQLNAHAQFLVTTAEDAGFRGSVRSPGEYWFGAKHETEAFGWPGLIEVRCLRHSMVLSLSENGWTAGDVFMGHDTPETLEHIKLNMRMLCAFAIAEHKPTATYGPPYYQPVAPAQEMR